MHCRVALAALAVIGPVSTTPLSRLSPGFADTLFSYAKAFRDPSIHSSAGGKAICIEGTLDITASANNLRLNLESPANRSVVTELVTELLQVNSTLGERLAGGPSPVNGTFGIRSQLCIPVRGAQSSVLQFLVHGAGFDMSYWDYAPGYSYVDFAAEEGYTTFLFDRLGSGQSDHPDPIQLVQINLQVAINHQLVNILRNGGIRGQRFDRVVGIGHSHGSANVLGVTAAYPADFDAVVLTGYSSNSTTPVALATLDLTMASIGQPLRLSQLANGYVTAGSTAGIQSFFFRAPGFDPALLRLSEATAQTHSLGEILAPGAQSAPNFTGPIDVVNGLNDFPNCGGDCLYPVNLAAALKAVRYPNAKNSSSYLAPDTGHGLNLHYSANQSYAHIHGFLKDNGF